MELHDYHRANRLCFKCGEKFDPAHVCRQKQAAALKVMENGECPLLLSEEVLNKMEINNVATSQQIACHPCYRWF
jgi:ribosomal protein L32